MKSAKERRQKLIIVIGGALLLILLAIQLPRLLNSGSSAAAPTTTTPQTPTASSSLSNSDPKAAMLAASRTTNTKLPDSDVPPQRTRTQLVTFERFDSKDPFVQQVSAESAPQTTAPAAASAVPTTPTTVSVPATPAGSGGAAPQPGTTAEASSRKLTANIEVNGKRETVSIAQTFPKSNPTFKLESLADSVAMIGIANGAYASGAQSVALQAGKTLTLVDTANGMRYELRLVSAS